MPRFSRGLFVWFPKPYKPKWTVKIDDETITTRFIKGQFTMPLTFAIGSCTLLFDNSDSFFNDKYSGDESIEIQLDHGAGTTTMFKGFIDFPKERTEKRRRIEIQGRHVGGELQEIAVTKDYPEQEVSEVITDLISTFGPSGFTTTNVEATSPTVSKAFRFQGKPLWDAIKEVCRSASAEAYVDDDKDLHFFQPSTKSAITNDAVVYSQNLIGLRNFGKDNFPKKTRIRVVGQDANGLPIVWTESTSGTGRSREGPPFRDTNLRTLEQVKAFALAKKTELERIETEGEAASLGLPNARPGDNIWVVDKRAKVHGTFTIVELMHKFGSGSGWKTFTTLQKEVSSTTPVLFKELFEKNLQQQNFENINNLSNSFPINFLNNSEIFSFTNTEINSKRGLVLTSGNNTGSALTQRHLTSSTVSNFELRVSGEDLSESTFDVSIDGGVTFETDVTLDTKISTSNIGSGMRIQLRVNLDDNSGDLNPAIKSAVVLYE